MQVESRLLKPITSTVSRAEMAQALNMVLFHDLQQRVPEGLAYVQDVVSGGGQITLDHGALRTVAWPSGTLPAGEASISRVLRPLGFQVSHTYPLPKLKMTGRAWTHVDFPETISQFFVSELHPELFSATFQLAVTRVVASSVDPLAAQDVARLECLSRDGVLPWPCAIELLPRIIACFARQHSKPLFSDYEILRAESAEMAWISTEGNAFNHATDRVRDVEAVSAAQRQCGRAVKDTIEISRSGRIKQTALRAAVVTREFLQGNDWVRREVPGSFFEFIERERLPCGALDLAFDAGNASAIFKMTANEV
ncbi:MAG: 2-oxoadipate dioxygenase/decarboxylase family protein [Burkholderiales bacterium]